jgi:Tol biopolymer transport system component
MIHLATRFARAGTIIATATLVAVIGTSAQARPITTRTSVTSRGKQGNNNSGAARTAGTGRFVAFESNASNLVRHDTNGVSDIFVRDRGTKKTFRVSVGGRHRQANGPSHTVNLSPNGRFVVFESYATNLVKGDTNGTWDVFLRDRAKRKTYRISVNSSRVQGNGFSADPVVSADGRYVAFESNASNLVPNDSNGAVTDVFERDRATGKTYLVSLSSKGAHGNASSSDPRMSLNGRYIVFESTANNLVKGDTAGETDILFRDMVTHNTTRISVNSKGVQGNAGSYSARVTPDGRFVAFESFSSNLAGKDGNHAADVFLRDRATRRTYRISVSSNEHLGNGYSSDPSISADGRYVAFESAASNFTASDTNAHVDAFVRDRTTGTTRCVSLTPAGHVGNAASSDPSLSADGRIVIFESWASNLVKNDTNGHKDIFARGPLR